MTEAREKLKWRAKNGCLVAPKLTPTQRLVLWILTDHADAVSGVCWPSEARMARQMSISVRTVKRCIKELKRTPYLKLMTLGNSINRSSQYRVDLKKLILTFENWEGNRGVNWCQSDTSPIDEGSSINRRTVQTGANLSSTWCQPVQELVTKWPPNPCIEPLHGTLEGRARPISSGDLSESQLTPEQEERPQGSPKEEEGEAVQKFQPPTSF
jgi:hypothetical protein